MKFTQVILLATCAVASPAGLSIPNGCPLEKCLFKNSLPPAFKPAASSFCTAFLGDKLCKTTKTVTKTNTVTKTKTPATATQVSTTITTTTLGTVCATTSTITAAATLTTSIDYVTYNPTGVAGRALTARDPSADELEERGLAAPTWFTAGCAVKYPAMAVSAACDCFIGTQTITKTKTASKTITVTAATPITTITSTATVSTTECTSTSTATTIVAGAGGAFTATCGTTFTAYPSASASGAVTCASTLPQPSSNALFRIEGNESDGTIFEGCIESGPRSITTPSGGTHQCDGTNNNANPAPGTTPTDQIDAAGRLIGFDFDGSFSNQFSDFFITRIAGSSQTGNEFWGVLQNGQYTYGGGCQVVTGQGDSNLWAYNSFNKNYNLNVSPSYAVAEAGSGTVTVTVSDAFGGGNVGGASIGGQTSDNNGQVAISVPSTPGCYQLKATHPNGIRSNAFYLTVVDQFAGGGASQ